MYSRNLLWIFVILRYKDDTKYIKLYLSHFLWWKSDVIDKNYNINTNKFILFLIIILIINVY